MNCKRSGLSRTALDMRPSGVRVKAHMANTARKVQNAMNQYTSVAWASSRPNHCGPTMRLP